MNIITAQSVEQKSKRANSALTTMTILPTGMGVVDMRGIEMMEPDKITCYSCEIELEENECCAINNSDEVYCKVCYDYMIEQGDITIDDMKTREWFEEWGEENI